MNAINRSYTHWIEKRAPFLDDVRELHEEGVSTAEIVRSLGISRNIVLSCLKDMRLTPLSWEKVNDIIRQKTLERHRRNRDKYGPEITALYNQGKSILYISNKLGISRNMVNNCLIDNGLHPRGGSEANRIRMSNMSYSERKRLTASANKAVRNQAGWERIPPGMAKRSEISKRYIGAFENDVTEKLVGRGFECRPQAAWQSYNIDILVNDLAVEVHTCTIRPIRHSTYFNKLMELLCAGISVCHYWTRPLNGITEGSIDELVSFIDESGRNPSPVGQYRVIRSNGEIDSIRHVYLDNFTCIVARYCASRPTG